MSFNMNLRGASGASSPSQTGNIIPKGHRYGQINQWTPQQHEISAQQQQLVGPGSYLSRLAGGDQSAFEQTEAPALRQFQELQGNIASRFSQGGARRSSGFQNTANQASQDFASELASKRQGYQTDAIKELMSMYNEILGQKPYEQFLVQNAPKQPSFLKQLALGLVGGVGQGAGALAGGYGVNKLLGQNYGQNNSGTT